MEPRLSHLVPARLDGENQVAMGGTVRPLFGVMPFRPQTLFQLEAAQD
jgi:hypothetical protein